MRDVIAIGLICLAAILIGGWLYFHGGSTGFSESAVNTVSYTVIGQGSAAANIADRTNYRIQNEADLESLWKMVYDGDAPALPQIDFTKDEVLAVFDGEHATGGYSIRVSQVAEANGQRKVFIEHAAPESTCSGTQMVRPFQIIKIAATTKTLTHEDDTATGSCK